MAMTALDGDELAARCANDLLYGPWLEIDLISRQQWTEKFAEYGLKFIRSRAVNRKLKPEMRGTVLILRVEAADSLIDRTPRPMEQQAARATRLIIDEMLQEDCNVIAFYYKTLHRDPKERCEIHVNEYGFIGRLR